MKTKKYWKINVVIFMTEHHKELIIKEGQIIRSKVPNERILFLATNLGLLNRDMYETLKTIGESKGINDLMGDLSSIELDTLVDTLQSLLKERLVEIR